MLRSELFEQLAEKQVNALAEEVPGPGNEVFSLSTALDEAEGEPAVIELAWTEVLRGDYDGNGMVDEDDLLPLAEFLGSEIDYLSVSEADGVTWYPAGDIEAEDAGNWQLARMDGNRDGMLGIADVTVIAQHWGQRIDGYRIYRSLDGGEPQYIPWPGAEQAPLTISRLDARQLAGNNRLYGFTDQPLVAGEYTYTVRPYGVAAEGEGPDSRASSAAVSGIGFAGVLTASLQSDVSSGISPLTVQFDASASSVSNAVITEYRWDFDGDGMVDASGSEAVIQHVYGDAGGYSCILEVADNFGRNDQAVLQVIIDDAPQAGISLSSESAEERDKLAITLSSSPGSHPISGRILDLIGPVSWSYPVNSDNFVIEYTLAEAGEYRLSYLVTDENNVQTRAEAFLTVEPYFDEFKPEARITLSTESVLVGDDLQADGSESSVPEGEITTFFWVSDGAVFSSPTDQAMVTLSYPTGGYKRLRLNVTSDTGRMDSDEVNVFSRIEPIADLQGPSSVEYGKWATFSASSSVFFDGSSKRFDWDLDGDGEYEVLDGGDKKSVQGIEGPAGVEINVRITDEAGQSDTASRFVLYSPPAAASFSVTQDKGPQDRMVTLDASGSTGIGFDLYRWSFQYGDRIETTDPLLGLDGLPWEGSMWIGLEISIGGKWTERVYQNAYAGWCSEKTEIPLKFEIGGNFEPVTSSLGISHGNDVFLMTVADFGGASAGRDYAVTRISLVGDELQTGIPYIIDGGIDEPVMRPLAMAVLDGQLHVVYRGGPGWNYIYHMHSTDLSLQSWSEPVAIADGISESWADGDYIATADSLQVFYADSGSNMVTRRLEPAVSADWSAQVEVLDGTGTVQRLEAALCGGTPVVAWTSRVLDTDLGHYVYRPHYCSALDANGSSWGTPQLLDTLTTEHVMELQALEGQPSIVLLNSDAHNVFMRTLIADDASGANWQEQYLFDELPGTPYREDMEFVVIDGKPMILGWFLSHTLLAAQDALGSTWEPQLFFKDNFVALTHTSTVLVELAGYPLVVTYGETDSVTDHTVELHYPDDAPWAQ
ncbi:MAG: PKD domain-containing protein [bacterium]